MSKKPVSDHADSATESHDDGAAKPRMTRAERRAQEAQQQLYKKRHRLLFILVGVTIAVNVLLGFVLYESMVVQTERDRVQQAAEERARQAASAIENYLAERKAEVQQWAQSPELLAALQGDDPEAVVNITSRLAAGSVDLIALRAFRPGEASIQPEHQAPLRYAELDLIRRAVRRREVLPEAAPIDDVWHLQYASAVPAEGEGKAVGALLASYSGDGINNIIDAGEDSSGKLVLHQRFSSSKPFALRIDGAGQAAPAATHQVGSSYLSVEYTPSAALVRQSKELPGMWILVLSLAVTLGLVASLLLSRLLVRPKQAPAGEGLTLPKQYVDAQAAPKTPEDTEPESFDGGALRQDILDIEVIEEDEDILGLDNSAPRTPAPAPVPEGREVPDEVFRAYDIRGKVGPEGITPALARDIGMALGTEVQEQGESSIIVARDARSHSPELCEQLIEGLLASGCNVINIGVVPTPLMHFATFVLDETSSGVMVTASHNAAQYNGFKMVINGQTLSDGAIKDIRSRISAGKYLTGDGQEQHIEIVADYIDRIFSDVALAGDIRIVVDAGNAVTGVVAPALFEELGCDVIPLHCELDGSFPNHNPDPSIEANLQDLLAKVRETDADIGVAFDGDGDRLVVVTPAGKIIWPDHLLMLFAKDILSRNPGADVLFDVKCSKQLNQIVSGYGGRPIMWKTGHSHMKQKMAETGALLGGEYSGHIFIKERWYGFDDGLYTAARLLEIITLRDQSIDDVFAAFPTLPSTPEIRVAVPEAEKFALVEKLIAQGEFQNGKATTIDGLRVDFSKGWGLVRASNTGAEITLRFEAESDAVLEKLKLLFKRELKKIDNTLQLDF
ncbi:phosphomannomutase/phosphoglucomutase [Gilvimarinus agarilyticus]|uniref:phosphomannomutase/phosphoglucomutase n=1 Tax=Gilvimarinus agarilyticus TaxID=679259 RepID=UPI0005A2268B|nr:phosphomannomutase/phosphoglucomutase [Gilvimarinus agarilyticus]